MVFGYFKSAQFSDLPAFYLHKSEFFTPVGYAAISSEVNRIQKHDIIVSQFRPIERLRARESALFWNNGKGLASDDKRLFAL
jgi:hypothetical protein